MTRFTPTANPRRILAAAILCAATLVASHAGANGIRPHTLAESKAEARLLQVYELVRQGRSREALNQVEALVQQHPNFQLAQLLYGDLLTAHMKPLRTFGDIPDDLARTSPRNLQELREESALRLRAFTQRPAAGTLPAEFIALARSNRHAIAVDVSRARLYLLENRNGQVNLVADYYISVGKAGIGKVQEGDQRTPVGLYFITSSLDPRSLKDLYGSGALPINYPNAYDQRRGKTGSGIWLHGTPSAQFSRAPWATDGCVAVANPDLNHIISTVQIRTTPVLIADRLDWVPQQAVAPQRSQLGALLNSWTLAKSRGDIDALMSLYAPDFQAEGRSLAAHREWLQADVTRARGRGVRIDDASILAWGNGVDVRVITFAEFVGNARAGRIVRQYWERQGGSWKIVYEGVLG